jgi:uncharacterized OB-fold protein
MMVEETERKKIPIREGLLSTPLSPLEDVRLLGSKCKDCGEVGLGAVTSCQNCAGENLEVIPLSQNGKLWTYTVIRNRPPGDFKGKVPMGEGLVELPEGIRVKSPLGGDVEKLEIGMNLKFIAYPLYENESGDEVIAFRFDPA